MGRAPCCDHKAGLNKGAWTAEEDQKLVYFIQRNNGHGRWRTLPQLAGLKRCGKSCRLRWKNYLRPNIKHGNFSPEEDRIVLQLHGLVGNRWSTIASHLPGRTDNEVKNHWNTHLKKRLLRMGIDPTTHLPIIKVHQQSCHIAQWELARMEAEAMLAATGGTGASCTSSPSSGRLIDYDLNRRHGEYIGVPQRAAPPHGYMALQDSWADALRNQAYTVLSSQPAINEADPHAASDLSLDDISSASCSAVNSHDLFQSSQGGGLVNKPECSLRISNVAVEMPAHDYSNHASLISLSVQPHHLSSSHSTPSSHRSGLSFLPEVFSPISGVSSDYPLAQSCDEDHAYWASMLNLVGAP